MSMGGNSQYNNSKTLTALIIDNFVSLEVSTFSTLGEYEYFVDTARDLFESYKKIYQEVVKNLWID